MTIICKIHQFFFLLLFFVYIPFPQSLVNFTNGGHDEVYKSQFFKENVF